MVIMPNRKRYWQDESEKEIWKGGISSEAEKGEIQKTSDEDNLEMSTGTLLRVGEEDISSEAEKGEIQETRDKDNLEMSMEKHLHDNKSDGEGDISSEAHKDVIQETSDKDNLEMSMEKHLHDNKSDGEGDISSEAHKGEIDEICQKDDLEMSLETQNKRVMDSCILHCSVLPNHYEFTKEMLVWLWVAQGLIKADGDGELEKEGIKFFDNLLNLKFFVPSRYDHNCDQMKYVMGDEMATSLKQQSLGSRFGKVLGNEQNDSTKLEHLSLSSEEIDRIDFGILKRCNNLQTLIIHRCYGSKVVRLPSDILAKMKSLKVLSLSHTNLVELPSSVLNLGELQYLDMSNTPIKRLPESLSCLVNLQTLQLESCLNLVRLPKCMNKLTKLRHLVLDIARQLQSMPTRIGELTELRTLRTFLVGQDDGCTIVELKNMNKLTGSLRILKLENVLSKEEASTTCLHEKKYLKTIELRWSDLQDEKNGAEEEILECLRPPSSIQELTILFYSGGVFPSWISNPSFNEMVSLTLYKCRYCSSMPSLGELTSLKYLSIVGMNGVMEINCLFCRKESNNHRVAFPKLEKLSFDSMSCLERWTGIEDGDFPCLSHLVIEYCPKFVSLEFLSHLKSLLHFEIRYCPELSSLPENGLPPQLESLMIKECPKLTERCCNDESEEWPKVAHVPTFYIDNQKVSADT